MAGEKRKLLDEARALGMSLAALRALPVSEVRKRIESRVREIRVAVARSTKRR